MFALSARHACLLASVFVSSLAAFGCATPKGDEDAAGEPAEEASDELRIPGLGFGFGGGGKGQVVVAPGGLFSTLVNANGSGCPKGSWTAGISPDGQTFTITFSSYETKVSPGVANDIKDCAIDVALVGTSKLKFSIGSLYYQGYVLLENPQMSALQTADYSFGPAGIVTGLLGVGVPLPGELHSQNAVNGPIDQSFVITDNVGVRWSPCSQANNLHIRTQLRLQNDGAQSGSGYLNASTVDGTLSFAWKMNWERC